MEPRIQYAKTDERVRKAFCTEGEGGHSFGYACLFEVIEEQESYRNHRLTKSNEP